MVNQEDIYNAIKGERWDYLIDVLHKNKKNISSDPMLTQSMKVFENEFCKKFCENETIQKNTIVNAETLWMLDRSKHYKLEKANVDYLIRGIVNHKKDNSFEQAYQYALFLPEDEICKKVIAEYQKNQPTIINHSQFEAISVTQNNKVDNVDYRINLFKSNQEIDFFYALRKVFDSYQIYPNVAISCLLNWEFLNSQLDTEEKEFFFKGIVDFVVFDQAEDFKPLYIFELDSIWHDTTKQKEKDSIKNRIFAKSGVTLYRIRKEKDHVGTQEFVKLIREIIKTDNK